MSNMQNDHSTSWAVIEEIWYGGNPASIGDGFVTLCDSQQDAEDLARRNWRHLTDQEKRRNTIYAALVELEWDEATEGWTTGDTLRIALKLGV